MENNNPVTDAAAAAAHPYHVAVSQADETKTKDCNDSSSQPQSKKEEEDSAISRVTHDVTTHNDGTSSNPPLPAEEVDGGSSITFKFSYEPRDYERNYYDKLFYHVASSTTSNISPTDGDKPKNGETIVSPKEAAKLFYTSGVPPERLRMIWNMATLPSTPLPPRSKPPPAMTIGQFRVAVRLIQLFQNRVAAVDEQLNVSDVARAVYSVDGEGGYVLNKSDELAPAYFHGTSGDIVPLPNTAEMVINKTSEVVKTIESDKSQRQQRRRSLRNSLSSSLSSSEEKKHHNNGKMNGWQESSSNNIPRNMPSHQEQTNVQPMPLVEMEREIRRLSAEVSILKREVEELKRGNSYGQRSYVDDDDPSVDVEIYWGENKGEQSPHERTRVRAPALKASKLSTSSINTKSSVASTPLYPATNNGVNNVRSNRLSQSLNIPTVHPSSRRVKGNIQASQQPMTISEEGSLTAQMHAVRREEEFDALLNHTRDRMEGDGGSNAGSRQSNRADSFRPARINQSIAMQRRNPNGNRPSILAASAHILRDETGKVEVYSKKEVEVPSTKAVDLAPLNPPPLQFTYEEINPHASTTQNQKSTKGLGIIRSSSWLGRQA